MDHHFIILSNEAAKERWYLFYELSSDERYGTKKILWGGGVEPFINHIQIKVWTCVQEIFFHQRVLQGSINKRITKRIVTWISKSNAII